jgi:glyoxylase-like metal-dependent hydrolase (beta-lactamase superfamily II)
MDVRALPLGPLQTNCFLLSENGRAVAVDPGGDPGPVLRVLEQESLTLERILNTHLHFDHTAGNAALAKATGAPIQASKNDAPLLDTEIGRGGFMGLPEIEMYQFEDIAPGEHEILGQPCEVLSTPGHSPGSLSFYFPEASAVFVGDLVFQRSIGRTDFEGGSMETLLESAKKHVFTLPDATRIYAGHGPATTVGDEKLHNPFFRDTGL